jgi:hypothetical protein
MQSAERLLHKFLCLSRFVLWIKQILLDINRQSK